MSRRDIGPLVGTANGRLLDKSGTVVATEDSDRDELPPYFNEDRKAAIEGDMVLALTLDGHAKLKEVHVLKSLSPRLDEVAVKTVRRWKFKLTNGSPDVARQNLRLTLSYRGECDPRI
ncbi:MAG TPA: cell division protein FtsQ/DivIB [Terriglobales bacterium]|jgi:TonB family protein|nr:cell division protein FtsQ/DivIB [Terriglobales bacterium]